MSAPACVPIWTLEEFKRIAQVTWLSTTLKDRPQSLTPSQRRSKKPNGILNGILDGRGGARKKKNLFEPADALPRLERVASRSLQLRYVSGLRCGRSRQCTFTRARVAFQKHAQDLSSPL